MPPRSRSPRLRHALLWTTAAIVLTLDVVLLDRAWDRMDDPGPATIWIRTDLRAGQGPPPDLTLEERIERLRRRGDELPFFTGCFLEEPRPGLAADLSE